MKKSRPIMTVPVSITASGAQLGLAGSALPVAGRRPRITLTVMPPSLGAPARWVDYLPGNVAAAGGADVTREYGQRRQRIRLTLLPHNGSWNAREGWGGGARRTCRRSLITRRSWARTRSRTSHTAV